MQPLKALVIDDEMPSRNFLTKMLQQYFPEISIVGDAATVKEGLEHVRKYNPDVPERVFRLRSYIRKHSSRKSRRIMYFLPNIVK
ncbi:MAG: hypothetical protein ABIY62_06095, partial [Ginsengibacter sp.]